LEREPHLFLEGVLIAAWVVKAEKAFIYIRDEYPDAIAILKKELALLESMGVVTSGYVEIRRGAGAYICGEESAMIESIEGKKGLPRHRPPYVAQKGIFDRPTLVHNVETLCWVAKILRLGEDVYVGHGRNGRVGVRAFSVSGRVQEPGVKIASAGITVRELIDEYCGGMRDGHKLAAYLPGGASGGILPANLDNIPLDFDVLQEYECFIGSAAIVVLSDKDDIREAAVNLMRFFEHESCGQCTPCRVGCEKAVKLMEKKRWDEAIFSDLHDTMCDASICGLGQAAPNVFKSVMKHWPDLIGLGSSPPLDG
jgi:formate dehydrogenase